MNETPRPLPKGKSQPSLQAQITRLYRAFRVYLENDRSNLYASDEALKILNEKEDDQQLNR